MSGKHGTLRRRTRVEQTVGGGVSLCAAPASTHRDVAVDDQQLLPGHVELAAEFVGFPVDYSETLVVWVEDRLQELQLGLQPRHRHLLLISNQQAAGRGEVGAGCDRAVESGLRISHVSVRTTTKSWGVRLTVRVQRQEETPAVPTPLYFIPRS